jgi:hypothetical protein
MKCEGKHLLANHSFITKNFLTNNKWVVFKQFMCQEMIDDLSDVKLSEYLEEELSEYLTNEDRKRKLDCLLDDKPIEHTLSEQIAENIKKNNLLFLNKLPKK